MIESKPKHQHLQKLRGWTLKFLTELEIEFNLRTQEGVCIGRSTRQIADNTGCNVRVAAATLQRMRSYGLIERVEGWGWKITTKGLKGLKINQKPEPKQIQEHAPEKINEFFGIKIIASTPE